MLFIDNKYSRIYFRIVERAQTRTLVGYQERHHIIPKSFYKKGGKTGWLDGNPNTLDNLVDLTAREHYICHLLLPKMLEGNHKYKMLCAIIRMTKNAQQNHVKISSRIYESVKIEKARLHSKLFSGNLNHFYGKSHSEETKEKLRAARQRQVERQGDTMPAEAREKLSKAAKGRVFTEEHKQKISNAQKGKPKTPHARITCPHCEKTGGAGPMKRLHFDKCPKAPANKVLVE